MNIREYADIMKWVMKNQIDCLMDEVGKEFCQTEFQAGYCEGIKRGLEIAMEKIDASEFLMNK